LKIFSGLFWIRTLTGVVLTSGENAPPIFLLFPGVLTSISAFLGEDKLAVVMMTGDFCLFKLDFGVLKGELLAGVCI